MCISDRSIGAEKKQIVLTSLKQGLSHKEAARQAGVGLATVDRLARELNVVFLLEQRLADREQEYYQHLVAEHNYEV